MSNATRYYYDALCRTLIKSPQGGSLKIMEDDNLVWRNPGPDDETYLRAIYCGQGCWERLDILDEEEARQILTRWGYSFPEESPEQTTFTTIGEN